jgi:hypothetical protein
MTTNLRHFPHKARQQRRHRVVMWCELLKAMLEDRPLTLLERSPTPHATPKQLALPL